MSWFSKLKQWIQFRRNDDAYATTREKLWQGVKEATERQLLLERSIWMVAHFPDTFVLMQEQVNQWGLEYSIAKEPITTESLAGPNRDLLSPGSIHLVLADLVPPDEAISEASLMGNVAAMIVERHPYMPCDATLHRYFKSISATGLRVELGYFMAFDDPLVAAVLNETTVQVLNQLGLQSHNLINSMTLTRRLERQLQKQQAKYVSNIDAENVVQWLKLNSPDLSS
ncbi:hypothetical protein N9Y42_00175 [Mariniblastus sp.]|nr:hypothetical protein [Mariniblastus sp.]